MVSLRAKGKKLLVPNLYIRVRGIDLYDWDVITRYKEILHLIREATLMVKARGKAGVHRAI